MSTYALMSLCNAAIIYGTKMGVELTSVGLPVIVAGEAWIRNKGLTLDASSPEEYFRLLDAAAVRRAASAPPQLARARRYAYHFFFNRMIPLPFIEPKAGYPIYRLKLDRLQQLLPGRVSGPRHDLRRHPRRSAPFVLDATGTRQLADLARALIPSAVSLADCPARSRSLIFARWRSSSRSAPSCAACAPRRRSAPSCRRVPIAGTASRRRRWAGSRLRSRTMLAFGVGRAARRARRCSGEPGCRCCWRPLAMFVRRRPRRSAAAVAARQAGVVAHHRRVPGLLAAGAQPDGALPLAAHAGRHDLVRRASATRSTCSTTWTAWPAGVALIAAVVPGVAAGRRARRPARRCCWWRWPARCSDSCSGTGRPRGCSWATAGACSSARSLGGASLVPVFRSARSPSVSPSVLVVLDPRRAALRHRVRAGAAAAGRPQARRRAAPITCRTAWCRSGSRSAARCASCTCSGSSAACAAWVLGRRRHRADGPARGRSSRCVVTLVGIYLARVPAYNAAGFPGARRSRRSRRSSRT